MTGPIILGAMLAQSVSPLFDTIMAKRDGKQSFLAAYIDHRLREIGYSVKDVAEAMGVTRQFLYGVLRGETQVPDSLLTKLAQATDITFSELVAAHAVDMLVTADEEGVV